MPADQAKRDMLTQPVTVLRGVGPKVAKQLQRLRVEIVRDLLFHLPIRYQDRTRVAAIGALRPGDEALINGVIELAQVQFGRRRSLLVRLSDGTGAVLLRFFHFSKSQQLKLQKGAQLRCFGEVRRGPASVEMVHPEYSFVDAEFATAAEARLTPIYRMTEGLNQPSLRKLTDQALVFAAELDDHALASLLNDETELPTLSQAIQYVHRPPPDAPITTLLEHRHPTQHRLVIDELLAHQLSLRQVRELVKNRNAPDLSGDQELAAKLNDALAFSLTGAQQRVLAEISADLGSGKPMLRLLQGDVGSGKTIVSALAAAAALQRNQQVVIMAPTELLAEQHLRTFESWFTPLAVPVLWLSGKLKRAERRLALEEIKQRCPAIIVGTHALFQEEVEFRNLAMVIIDEQHRFGVQQRLMLRDKGVDEESCPHQLIMTATPIPRTLAMTAYADLDTSTIDELPPHRQQIKTSVIPDTRRDGIVERVRSACLAKRQIYWVCTLIEESDTLQCQAATDCAAELQAAIPEACVGLIHGRLSSQEKEGMMASFAAGNTDLLVATTVIEVGVDVPNATLMIIENAERLGLAQLHQLRGRVGRGSQQSDCVLLYRGPLSSMAKERLAIMRKTTDGFEISEKDLELRGPGELLGTRQAGLAELRIADLVRDRALLPLVSELADAMLEEFPDEVATTVERWLGNSLEYGDV